MTIHSSTWLVRRKWILAAIGLAVLFALWWAFRPEKLWINEKVNEAAPFETSGAPQPIVTGRFDGKAQQTSGRATIYKKAGGEEYLHLSDFATPSADDIHIVLARGDEQNLAQDIGKGALDPIDLGPLKSNQGDQNYELTAATDLSKYDSVAIYSERFHTIMGVAKLEPF
jgi:Electron transfer DM13